jgi:hypothetical protein
MKKILELLKSGNFTIVYWDNDSPTLYKGKWNINKEYEKDDYEEMNKNIVEELDDYCEYGYCPGIVALLVKALGGKSDSI